MTETDYDVTLEWPNGRTETVAVGARESILEAALREGIRLPYDCRKGTCTTCVGRVVAVDGDGDGETDADANADAAAQSDALDASRAVDYRRSPTALTDRDRANGYALLCIAIPRTNCRVEVGPRVRAGVEESPWS